MKIQMTMTGKDQLAKNLIGVGRAVGKTELEKSVIAGGNVIARRAAELAPKDTGRGARGIRTRIVESTPERVDSVIGPGSDGWYLMFHEFGTSKLAARPFLRPAFDELQDVAERRIRDIWWRLIKGAVS